jgi:hypothetical protein
MIGLNEREVRYEVQIQRLLRRPDAQDRRIVCLSNRFQARPPFASNTDPSGRDESWRMSAR